MLEPNDQVPVTVQVTVPVQAAALGQMRLLEPTLRA